MDIKFNLEAWKHYQYWIDNDPKILKKVNVLIEDSMRNLYKGLGQPEVLHALLAGYCSKKISGVDRLVFRIKGDKKDQHIEIIRCKGHYKD